MKNIILPEPYTAARERSVTLEVTAKLGTVYQSAEAP